MKTELKVGNKLIVLPLGTGIEDLEKHIARGDKFTINGTTYTITDKNFIYDALTDTYWAELSGA